MRRELEQLILQYLDGEISRDGFQLLQDKLRSDPEARRIFYDHVRMKRLIRIENAMINGGLQDEIPLWLHEADSKIVRMRVFLTPALTIAACMVLIAGIWYGSAYLSLKDAITVSGSPNSAWQIDGAEGGGALASGQRLVITSGVVSLEYPSGTRISGQAPVTLEIEGDQSVGLVSGNAFFDVAEEDHGFSVHTPRARYVDLGTSFGISADRIDGDELHVSQGVVRLELPDEQPEITERKAIGVMGGNRVSNPIRYEGFRFVTGSSSDYSYVHWSFDEPDGALDCRATGTAPGVENFGGLINTPDGSMPRGERTPGAFGSALKFNGSDFVNTAYPGVGDQSPRTVAFWYRDETATGPLLENPYHDQPLVMWGYPGGVEKLGRWQIKIRRHKSEVAPGRQVFRVITAPRGNYQPVPGKRNWLSSNEVPIDNGWHHYASVYTGLESERPGRLLHYRDGVLIDEMELPVAPSTPTLPSNIDRLQPVRFGSHWGNLSSGSNSARREGEIDEVFIVHAALSSEEILRLANTNRL